MCEIIKWGTSRWKYIFTQILIHSSRQYLYLQKKSEQKLPRESNIYLIKENLSRKKKMKNPFINIIDVVYRDMERRRMALIYC